LCAWCSEFYLTVTVLVVQLEVCLFDQDDDSMPAEKFNAQKDVEIQQLRALKVWFCFYICATFLSSGVSSLFSNNILPH